MATETPREADASEPDRSDAGAAGGDGDAAPPHPAFADYLDEPVPQAAVGSPGKSGRLELRFGADADGDTNLTRDFARVPFHVSGTLGHDPHPDAETVYVQSPTGGVAQGDRHSIEISVGPDAVAHVSTQSATKVLSMECNCAIADVSLSVESGGHLDYVPAPAILHADARYCQDLTVDLAAGASAVVGDVVVPGRLAREERFEFERYAARCRVRQEGTLAVDDATHLHPADADPTAPGVLGEFAVYGTLYVLAPDADAADLSDRLHERASDATPPPGSGDGGPDDAAVRAGATALPNGAGVAVRALGHRAGPVMETLHAAWSAGREELLGVGAPDARRP